MQSSEDDSDKSTANDTDVRGRSRPTTRSPPFFIPRRPRVVKMRDLSQDTRNRLTREYYEVYDPWVGIRIAATLGILITFFTLFLIYKSKFNKSKNPLLPSKKTSLYLYDDDMGDFDLGSIGSSEHTSSYAYNYPFSKNKMDDRMMFPFQEGFQLEEVFVKNQVVECVALKVHRSGKRASKGGPKFEAIRISEDASRSLPCSPYKPEEQDTEIKVPHSPTYSTDPTSLTGSITSFGSTDTGVSVNRPSKMLGKVGKEFELKAKRSWNSSQEDPKTCPKSLVVTAKKPQDYRSRSTVVAIARRKRTS